MKLHLKITIIIFLSIFYVVTLQSCKKNPIPPVVSTTEVTNITRTTATTGGNVRDDGGVEVISRGVCWDTTMTPSLGSYFMSEDFQNFTSDGSGNGPFISIVSLLIPNSEYYIRAYAENSAGTGYGEPVKVKTITSIVFNPHLTYGSVVDMDGNVYKTIRIGTQTWMAENLKTTRYSNGELIGTTNPSVLDIFNEYNPKYQWPCNGSETNVEIFGRLYTWYTTIDNRGLCPSGWHVPSDAEWSTLESFLISNGYNFDGSSTGNKIAKSMAATSDWYISFQEGDVGKTDYPDLRNKSGFTALPSGERFLNGFIEPGTRSCFWSSTSFNDCFSYNRKVFAWSSSVDDNSTGSKSLGFSVRCIKN